MRLLIFALCASFAFEALTYHHSIDFLSNNINFAFGLPLPQSAIITTAIVALVKLVIVCACIDTSKTKSNLLVILLAMCALFDCFLIALFLNGGMYAILFNISEIFSDVYRAIEVVCIVSILFDAIHVLFYSPVVSGPGGHRDKASCGICVGDKV